MMPFLVVDVSYRGLDLRDSYCECTVSILPGEGSPLQVIIDPF
jgi:hypothetical protein